MKFLEYLARIIGKINRDSFLLIVFLFGSVISVPAQNVDFGYHFARKNCKKSTMKFKSVHNLIIIPVFINGSDTLNFILDTGVSGTILTGFEGINNISFNNARELSIYGLGEGGEVRAFHSAGNAIEIPGIEGYYQNILILKDEFYHLSQGLGIKINGLIGSDLFKSFVIEIDYDDSQIIFYDPEYYHSKLRIRKSKRAEVVRFTMESQKPYVLTSLVNNEGKEFPLKLLIDTGASNAVTLFKSLNQHMILPEKSMYTYIGLGLGGEIYGHLSRANNFSLGDCTFDRPIITFPDESSFKVADNSIERNGSIGGDMLKRFTVILDYKYGEMLLRPNDEFRSEFRYNMSGINITTPVPGLPMYEVSKVREGSPAWIAGIETGDQIKSINGVNTTELTLGNVIKMLQWRPGKKLRIDVQRAEEVITTRFILEDPI